MKTIKIKHIEDGKTDVMAKVLFTSEGINLEYRFEGMTWGRSIDFREAVEMGIIECNHPCVNPILGFENSQIGEICVVCNKEMMFNSYNEIKK